MYAAVPITAKKEELSSSVLPQSVLCLESTSFKRDSSMKPTAANSVFTIPELLELVVMNVSQFDLFVVQRVSRAFCSTIHSSPSLEQKLYAAAPYSQDPGAPARLVTVPQIQSTFHPTTMAHMQPEEVYGSYSRFLHHLHLGPFIRRAWIHHETKKVPVLAFFLYLDREHEKVGWQGMSAIHSQGSWKKMPLEMIKGESGQIMEGT